MKLKCDCPNNNILNSECVCEVVVIPFIEDLTVEKVDNKGSMVKCSHDKWFIDTDSQGNPCVWSSRNIPSHKATVKELIEKIK